ncbi:GntR family transcriptional regulator [Microvirga aerophila]|uniref:GntR family transcriptional regulator n=1 Tax=Microvirga aerophila TaxID=670291 RepID=A0A512BZ12_9HYPH|nr:GntR family transcriptional regulator [Microvirga aerophila]GEO17199.1 GntR family transcriptional regulator [Microvirga aerophila]
MNLKIVKAQKEFGKTVAADIAYRLREEILSCRLPPGEPLRFEALRASFGASFTTLREALMSLVADGLVAAEGQRGFRVAPISLDDLFDITSTRVLIEIEALRQAIAKGDDEWEIGIISALHRLNRIEERIKTPPGEDLNWRRAHREFHQALISACGSPTLLAIHDSLFDRSERYRSVSATYRPYDRNKVGEHRALMSATVGRDTDLAVKLIEKHIRDTADNVATYAAEHFDRPALHMTAKAALAK